MPEKSAKRPSLAATDSRPRPGDFPLGSLESRAAARSIIEHENELRPNDVVAEIDDAASFVHMAKLFLDPNLPKFEPSPSVPRCILKYTGDEKQLQSEMSRQNFSLE